MKTADRDNMMELALRAQVEKRSIFLSYSGETAKGRRANHKQRKWVLRLGRQLERDGFYVVMDQLTKLKAPEASALAQCVKVFVMILTDTYGMQMNHFFPGSGYSPGDVAGAPNDGVIFDEVQGAIAHQSATGAPYFVSVLREGSGRILNYPTMNMNDDATWEKRYEQLRLVLDQICQDPHHSFLRRLPRRGHCTYCDFEFDLAKHDVCQHCKRLFDASLDVCPSCNHRNRSDGVFVWWGFLDCFRCNGGVIIQSSSEDIVVGERDEVSLSNASVTPSSSE